MIKKPNDYFISSMLKKDLEVLALDIKKLNKYTVIYGIDKNESHLDEALTLGVIDKKSKIENNMKSFTS